MADTKVFEAIDSAYGIIDASNTSTSRHFRVYRNGTGAGDDIFTAFEDNRIVLGSVTGNGVDFDFSTSAKRIYLSNNNWTLQHLSASGNNDITIQSNDELTLKYGEYLSSSASLTIQHQATEVFSIDNNNVVKAHGEFRVYGAAHIGSTGAPNANAVLEVTSTNKGLILPRISGVPTGVNGMIVYDSNAHALKAYINGNWKTVTVA